MTLYTDLGDAWKQAMKDRDPKKDVLSAIRTEVKNKVINTQGNTATIDPADELTLDVLKKMAKQRKESIVEYEKGGRADLVDKETFELKIIEGFLPQSMSPDALLAIVKEAVAECGAQGAKDMGKAMKAAMAKVAGRADGKDVQAAVKAALG